MAKFQSQVYTKIRGSVGGITYTANQFASLIARARVSPVQPMTTFQTMMRSAFSGAQTYWQNLSDADRTAWNDYAETCQIQGPMGPYTVPGRQMFMACLGLATYWKARGLTIGAIATTPPSIPGWLNLDDVKAGTYAGPGTGFAVDACYYGTEDIVIGIQRTFAFNASRNRAQGPWIPSTLDEMQITPPACGHLEFDSLTDGLAYFAHVRGITAAAPFRISAEFIVRALAETVAA